MDNSDSSSSALGTATADTMATSSTTAEPGSSSTGADTTAGRDTSVRVLMLGNSYTQFNALHDLVDALGGSLSLDLHVEAITQGGATVADLVGRADVQAALSEQAWDFVAIQGQSYEPLVQPLVFEDAVVELAALATDAGAQPLLYETWARAAGHPLYDEPWSGGDPAGMQAGLSAAYASAAEASGATVAVVGQAWERSLAASPEIVLHTADGSHPTVAGSYLAAAVFVGVIGEEPVLGASWWPRGVSGEDAAALQEHADAAVAAAGDR